MIVELGTSILPLFGICFCWSDLGLNTFERKTRCVASGTMVILFIRDGAKMLPTYNCELDGFVDVDVSNPAHRLRHPQELTMKKGSIVTLGKFGGVQIPAHLSKPVSLALLHQNWGSFIEGASGVMGGEIDQKYEAGTTKDVATGVIFIKRFGTWASYKTSTAKGWAFVEMGDPASTINTVEKFSAIADNLSKKEMEQILRSIGRRVTSRGRETWMTETRYRNYFLANWSRIISMGGYVVEEEVAVVSETEGEDDEEETSSEEEESGGETEPAIFTNDGKALTLEEVLYGSANILEDNDDITDIINDTKDFIDNETHRKFSIMTLKDTHLFTIFVPRDYSVIELKEAIVRRIERMRDIKKITDGVSLSVDDFVLTDGIKMIGDGWHLSQLHHCLTRVQMLLRFKGGSKGVRVKKSTKEEKTKKTLAIAKESYKSLGGVKFDATALNRVKTLIDEMIGNTSNDYITKKMMQMKIEELKALKEGTADFKVNDGTVHRLAPLVIPELKYLGSLIDELTYAKKTAESCFTHVFHQEFYDGHCDANAFWRKYERALGKAEGSQTETIEKSMEGMQIG